jgi:hypothetical protein
VGSGFVVLRRTFHVDRAGVDCAITFRCSRLLIVVS